MRLAKIDGLWGEFDSWQGDAGDAVVWRVGVFGWVWVTPDEHGQKATRGEAIAAADAAIARAKESAG